MFAKNLIQTASVLLVMLAHTVAFAPGLVGVPAAPTVALRQSSFACGLSTPAPTMLETRGRTTSVGGARMSAQGANPATLSKVRRAVSLRTVVIGLFVVLSAGGANFNAGNTHRMAHVQAPVLTSTVDAAQQAQTSPRVLMTADAASASSEDGWSLVSYLRQNRDSMGYALAGIFAMAAFGIPSTVCLFSGAKIGGVLGSIFICAGSLLALFRTIDLIRGPGPK
mmetsp:Transcript_24878/g.49724  ORF Transcript_24878/g.49724 Transcript_24878/m.49724 type:complete len:224 (+) Transcript_24878:121-792(+)